MAKSELPAPKRKKRSQSDATRQPVSTEHQPLTRVESAVEKRSPKQRAAKAVRAPTALNESHGPVAMAGSSKRRRNDSSTPKSTDLQAPLQKKSRSQTASGQSGSPNAAITVSEEVLTMADVCKTALDVPQVGRAVHALQTHVKRERNGELLDADPPVHVLIAMKQMPKPTGKATACKPIPLKLPHPYQSLETAEICLITKDPQREYKDRLADVGLRAKVIGISKLKKKHKEYEAKRQLMGDYDIFLADARVLPMLPPLLGKGFFQKRKLPAPMDLTKKDLRGEIERIVCGTLFRHTKGTSNSIQVGTTAQSQLQLVDNIVASVEQAIKRVPGKWNNIQSLSLRTTNSIALPFYNSLPHA